MAQTQDAGIPADAGIDALPAQLIVTLRHHLADGGITSVQADGGIRAQIEPTRFLELTTNFPIHNYRIRVFDETDRALVSDDLALELDYLLDYQIRFPERLKPGHRYTLLMDAQSGDSILDAQGRRHPEQRFELKIAGAREKTRPAKGGKRKRRRRSELHHLSLPLISKSLPQVVIPVGRPKADQ